MQHAFTRAQLGHANYAAQFKEALFVNGGDDDEGDDEEGGSKAPQVIDYVMHTVNLPWKLLCAFIPPTDYCGGWACFVGALLVIGAITALIGDLASLLGCVLTIPDEVTAITFVALGTSLPDTFASMAAAQEDPYADASVGNVTGSNCVNVFLGLGMPWTIASIYWTIKGKSDEWISRYGDDRDISAGFRESGAFVVKAGTLSTSVIIFSCFALACLCVLYIRRKKFGGELGGPRNPAIITSIGLVLLWMLYVVLSSWVALANKPDC
jgi:solute carrier family 8 (sodium/calcium exchanger)